MNIPEHIAAKLSSFFDQVLVISLPRFGERHAQVTNRLNGLPFRFFWGADKMDLPDNSYDQASAIRLHRHGKPLCMGEVACALSHRMAYEEMIRNGWKKMLLLEDDVLPLYDRLALLPGVLEELPRDWELVYFGYLKHEKVTIGLRIKQMFYCVGSFLGLMKWTPIMVKNLLPRKFTAHVKKAGFHDCTHAYAITIEAARKLAALQKPVVYRADDLLSYAIMRGEIRAFVTEPKFFDQENFHSAGMVSEVR